MKDNLLVFKSLIIQSRAELLAFVSIAAVIWPFTAWAVEPSPTLNVSRYSPAGVNQFTYTLDSEVNGNEVSANYQRHCATILDQQIEAGLARTKLPPELKMQYIELSKAMQGIHFVEAELSATDTANKKRTAIAWVIPNIFPFSAGLMNPLPWQRETVFKSAEEKILGTKTAKANSHPYSLLAPGLYTPSFDTEFGRLTQFENGHGKYIYPSLGMLAFTQAVAAGANPLTSHVYLHSASPVNTRLYQMRLNVQPIYTVKDNGVEHALFKVPLVDFMQNLPPVRHFETSS